MSRIKATDTYRFEQWLLANYPDLFEEWEMEACGWIELDEWLEREHYEVIDEWYKSDD